MQVTIQQKKYSRLPEMIARSKGCHIVVCIDEFQQIGDFPDSLTFQKKLRSVWQLQSHVSYCLYGSKKHMMEQMFQNAGYPFYRFGDFFYLNKISEKDWVEYICQRFESTGKHISEELACEICQVTDRYSSYVQQLAWFVWLRVQDDSAATEEDLKYGIDRLLDACEPLFIQQTEDLSAYQMNFLHAHHQWSTYRLHADSDIGNLSSGYCRQCNPPQEILDGERSDYDSCS